VATLPLGGGVGHPLGGERPPHYFLLIILLFYIYFKILNNILLFYIGWDTWQVGSCWMKMSGLDFQKKPIGNS
jgi:hypothetical protein